MLGQTTGILTWAAIVVVQVVVPGQVFLDNEPRSKIYQLT